jgi:RNA polymerase sigma-70 factor (ECF subfamily)
MLDDQELMARVRDGEESALEQLFARWEGALFAFFYRLGCPPSAVEDLTEEVLVSLYRQRRRYEVGRPLAPWLYGIARLVWKDYLRHRGREMRHTAPLEAAGAVPSSDLGPEGLAETREAVDAVRSGIRHLSEEQRVVFLLRHYQGLSYQEISDTLEVPLGTVKWGLHEAVRRLEEWLPVSRREGA